MRLGWNVNIVTPMLPWFPLSEWSSSCTQPFKLQLESQLLTFVLVHCFATDVQVEEVDLYEYQSAGN